MNTMNLILGTMTFGQQTLDEAAAAMVRMGLEQGIRELDTAYVYNDGESERIVGRVLATLPENSCRIATKVNPRVTGRLDRAAVLAQLEVSLERLQRDRVDILYLHFPDRSVPLEEVLETCHSLYVQGKFRELGLSNYPASLVEEACRLCRERGWVAPTVYEGVYNVLSRNAEGELFDTIRRHGIRFTAYNPLAGGLLTGKYRSADELPADGRFVQRAGYKQRYWKPRFFEAVATLRTACEQAGIPMAQAALRWLAYHSQMNAACGDGIIIGASKPAQLAQNAQALGEGPLPSAVAAVYDAAWELCREDAPPYFRFLS